MIFHSLWTSKNWNKIHHMLLQMVDSSVLKTQKWSFVKCCNLKCKYSWICKIYFNIAAILCGEPTQLYIVTALWMFYQNTFFFNHRMAWVEKDLKDHHLVSTPLSCAGLPTTRPGCSEPRPAWSWMHPGMGHPQPPWATCSSAMAHAFLDGSFSFDLDYNISINS